VYHRNGIVYIFRRKELIDDKSIMGEKTGAYIVAGDHTSIDTEFDFSLVEMILLQNK